MNKQIGFNRNLRLSWLDATAACCAESRDADGIRQRLEVVVGQDIQSAENRRKAIDLLLNIWLKSGSIDPALYAAAIECVRSGAERADRIWLHYGLTLLTYAFFRETAAAIGQLSRLEESITAAAVKKRLVASRGQLGSLGKAVERVIFSLRDWGLVADGAGRHGYVPQRRSQAAGSIDLECWLIECALHAHPAEEIPFADLLRLPELFPFRFSVSLDHLRQRPRLAVHRQGTWDMIRLVCPSE